MRGFPREAGEPTRPTRFPSRSGGNLKEGGQIMNFGRTIGISLAYVFVRFGAAIGISSVFECVCL
jgi:hypothetical protein